MYEIDPSDFGAFRAAADKHHHTEEMRLKVPPGVKAVLARLADGGSYWRDPRDVARDFIVLLAMKVVEGDDEMTGNLRRLRHLMWVENEEQKIEFWESCAVKMERLFSQAGSMRERKEYEDQCTEMLTWEDMPDKVRYDMESLVRRWGGGA